MGDAVVVIVGLVSGLALAALGGLLLLSQHALRKRLRRMPRTRARHVGPGDFVKMVGRLTTRAPMLAPLANVDCLYYRLAVLEGTGSSKGEQWTEVSSERMYAEEWMLEDESGRIEVQPEDGVLEYIRQREYDPKSSAPSDDIRRDVVMRYVPPQDRLIERPVRLREERLDQGASVVLFGRVTEGPRGLLIAGGHELEVYAQTEQQLAAPKPLDFLAWVFVVGGVVLLGWGAVSLGSRSESDAGGAVPIDRSATGTPPPLPVRKRLKSPAESAPAPAPAPAYKPPVYSPNRIRRH